MSADSSAELEVVATIRAREGRGDDLVEVVTAAIAQVRAEEGCLRYDLHRVRRDDDSFVMLERWASKEALRAHGEAPHFQAMSAQLADVLAEPPVVRVLSPIDVS